MANFFQKKENSQNSRWWIVITFVLLIVFGFALSYNYKPDLFVWGAKNTQQQTFNLPVTVVYNSSSTQQKAAVDNVLNKFTQLDSTKVQPKWLDAKSAEAWQLLAQSDIKYLPQIFIDDVVETHPQYDKLKPYLNKAGSNYFVRLPAFEFLHTPVANFGDHVKNDPNVAKVTIIAYENLLCDHCAAEQKIFNDLLKTYGKDLAVVYHHFVPGSIDNSYAQGVECAALQNKYFEMHDKLYADQPKVLEDLFKNDTEEGQRQLLRAELEKAAKSLGLNLKDFQACLASGVTEAAVENDTVKAINYGINAPPAFFINKTFRLGLQSYDDFKTLIDAELK